MHYFSTAVATLALVSLAIIPREARAAQIPVTVGGAGGVVAYDPQFVNASVGDEIVFTFKQKNHTVTQSSFASPCSFLAGGFDSGFNFVADNATTFPTTTVKVNDTNPIWFYCRQTGHCQQGMVFAVNPGNKFAAFQAAAEASGNATSTASLLSITSTPSVVTVTETVTASGNVWTTTYGSYPGSSEPTVAASTNHKIVVGGANLVYDPANITAQPGDTVTFQFMVKNHTATQSSFNDPCKKLELSTNGAKIGFDSGFMPVSSNATSFPEFSITVNDTAPIWVYCRQTGHCGQGMVFSVNAVEPNDFAAFQARAIAINGTNATSSSSASGSTSTSGGSSSGAITSYSGIRFGGAVATLAGLALGLML